MGDMTSDPLDAGHRQPRDLQPHQNLPDRRTRRNVSARAGGPAEAREATILPIISYGLSRDGQNVAWLIPAFRQTSPIGTPSSACFRMNAFWASENLLAFIAPPLLSRPSDRSRLSRRAAQFSGLRAH
jgi:hypothetical protein